MYVILNYYEFMKGEDMEPYEQMKTKLFANTMQALEDYHKAKADYSSQEGAMMAYPRMRYAAGVFIGLHGLIEDLGLEEEYIEYCRINGKEERK